MNSRTLKSESIDVTNETRQDRICNRPSDNNNNRSAKTQNKHKNGSEMSDARCSTDKKN